MKISLFAFIKYLVNKTKTNHDHTDFDASKLKCALVIFPSFQSDRMIFEIRFEGISLKVPVHSYERLFVFERILNFRKKCLSFVVETL